MTDSPRDDLESLPEGIEALRALVLRTIADRDATLVGRDAAVTERDILLFCLSLSGFCRRRIIERSTLSFWMGYAAAEVAPVVARLMPARHTQNLKRRAAPEPPVQQLDQAPSRQQ